MHRRTKLFAISLLGACGVGWAGSAGAQEKGEAPYLEQPLPAPSNAFELRMGAGYAQGIGNVAPGSTVLSVAGPGVGLGVDAAYRIDPSTSVGLETQYQEFATNNNTGSRGLATNVGFTYHFMPGRRGDPWVRLGTGYRLLWDVNHLGIAGNTNLYHGIDVVTAKIGYDIRPSSDVSLSPVIGADLQTFIWQDASALSSAQVATFLYAGIQGRFDTPAPATATAASSTSSSHGTASR